jgi:hypothetical protein
MYEIYIHENVMMKPIKIYKKIEKLAVTMSKNIGKLAYEEFIEFYHSRHIRKCFVLCLFYVNVGKLRKIRGGK